MSRSLSRRHRPVPLAGAAVAALALLLGAAVAPAPASAASQPTIRINAGGGAGTFEGVAWQADRWFVGGRTSSSDDPVRGTASSALFQERRVAPAGYDIPVLPGTYDVTLLSAETYWEADGERVFSARAEGTRLLGPTDLHAVVGHDTAHRVTQRLSVTDGTLDIDFAATTDNAVVAGIVVAPVTAAATPSPSPTATPTASPGWSAPALVDPLVWVPSPSHRVLKAPADRDVLVRWPTTALDGAGGYQITGGRNVVSVGGTIRYSGRHRLGAGGEADRNRCLYVRGHETQQAPRTVHVEGLRCAGPHIWEGIDIDSKAERGTLTVQLRDIVIDEVQGVAGTDGGHVGGDALQTWNGPHRLRVDGFDARNLHYQGIILQPYSYGSGPLGRWQLHDVYLEGDEDGCAYLMWLSGSRSGSTSVVPLTVTDVRVKTAPGKSAARTLWDRAEDWYDVQTILTPPA